jgi:hypothetical protein
MPQPTKLTKAEIHEVDLSKTDGSSKLILKVQFNPETLKVNFANEKAGGDQRGGPTTQFVGKGTTKLSLELWFDVTVPIADGKMQPDGDVRKLTENILYFMKPSKTGKKKPPGIRFIWGTFLFDGVMDSLDENLEFFSEEGKPLRSKVSINISSQELQLKFADKPSDPGIPSTPGTLPRLDVRQGDTAQKVAARIGKPDDWKSIALANNIENPRKLIPGISLDVNIDVNVRLN